VLDRDLILWIAGEPGIEDRIRQHPLHGRLRAAAEGREVFLTQMEGGAASFSSVISLPYLLESLVPRMAAAIDGDRATPGPRGIGPSQEFFVGFLAWAVVFGLATS
jgi:iron complex transport system substrate-binding protein